MTVHTRVKTEIIATARLTPDLETCGFIYADDRGLQSMPCANIAADPHEEFEISQDDHVRAHRAGRLFGVYHSISDSAAFSPADLDCADEMGVPFYLYSVKEGSWHEYTPSSYQPPLEGRPFVLGAWDCYGLLRDYFRAHHGHHLSDYDRDESFIHEEQGVIMASFEREGFERVDGAIWRPDDVLMFRTDKALPQHFGVYLGRQRMFHHPQRGLVGSEMVTDRWMSRLTGVFRLKTRPISV